MILFTGLRDNIKNYVSISHDKKGIFSNLHLVKFRNTIGNISSISEGKTRISAQSCYIRNYTIVELNFTSEARERNKEALYLVILQESLFIMNSEKSREDV